MLETMRKSSGCWCFRVAAYAGENNEYRPTYRDAPRSISIQFSRRQTTTITRAGKRRRRPRRPCVPDGTVRCAVKQKYGNGITPKLVGHWTDGRTAWVARVLVGDVNYEVRDDVVRWDVYGCACWWPGMGNDIGVRLRWYSIPLVMGRTVYDTGANRIVGGARAMTSS